MLAVAGICLTGQTQQPPARKTKFSHALHSKLGDPSPVLKAARKSRTHLRPDATEPGTGCQACHSGIASDVQRQPLSVMGDCLVCHTRTDPPFSCAFCHNQPAAELKPASHAADFLDRHSAGLAKLNLVKSECAVCHGRRFTCQGCH